MNELRWAQLLAIVFLMVVSMSGCGRGIFNTEPFVDTTTDAHGNRLLADTPRRWQDWREAVDPQVRAEASGKSAPGFATWNEKWGRMLFALESSQENAPKYIAYIIESRHHAGLPPLEGYPPPAGD